MALHAYYLGHQKSASSFNPLDPLIMLKKLADIGRRSVTVGFKRWLRDQQKAFSRLVE